MEVWNKGRKQIVKKVRKTNRKKRGNGLYKRIARN